NRDPPEDVTFYESDARAIQGKTQFIPTYSYETNYPKIESTIPAGIEENGVVLFEPLNPTLSEAQFRFEANKGIENVKFTFDVIVSPQDYYDIALAIDPNNSTTLTELGAALYNIGNYTGAIESFDRSLAIDPNDTIALYDKGIAFSSLGKHEEAIKSYDKVLAIDPNNLDALFDKGVDLGILGNHTEAIKYLDKFLATNPNEIYALNLKGFSLGFLGNYTGAIESFDRSLAIDPNNQLTLEGKNALLNQMNKR
ncbi:MAG: tetratricopeptide repeat protein, partial [Nitrosopumilus sp.]|nr:tetratricopeptide repeat protein [Nitrosopumilus sp.]